MKRDNLGANNIPPLGELTNRLDELEDFKNSEIIIHADQEHEAETLKLLKL